VNFTREPIIETIITPKDGYKLIVKSSKNNSEEEHLVDALEVVSFGHALFFRSLERPKSFLLPVSDYEVIETREAKIVLKNPTVDNKTIKIAGGKEQHPRHTPREYQPVEQQVVTSSETKDEEKETQQQPFHQHEKRKDKKRMRRRKPSDMRQGQVERPEEMSRDENQQVEGQSSRRGGDTTADETIVSSSMFTTLLPPPTTLISETIGRYKTMENAENIFSTDSVAVSTEPVQILSYEKPSTDELDQIWNVKSDEGLSVEEVPHDDEDQIQDDVSDVIELKESLKFQDEPSDEFTNHPTQD
jgi:hypothetical protein